MEYTPFNIAIGCLVLVVFKCMISIITKNNEFTAVGPDVVSVSEVQGVHFGPTRGGA